MEDLKNYKGTGIIGEIVVEEDKRWNELDYEGKETTKERYNLTTYWLTHIVENGKSIGFDLEDKFHIIKTRMTYNELIEKIKEINARQFQHNQPFAKIEKMDSNEEKQNKLIEKIIKDVEAK